jgi:hypothetical protein
MAARNGEDQRFFPQLHRPVTLLGDRERGRDHHVRLTVVEQPDDLLGRSLAQREPQVGKRGTEGVDQSRYIANTQGVQKRERNLAAPRIDDITQFVSRRTQRGERQTRSRQERRALKDRDHHRKIRSEQAEPIHIGINHRLIVAQVPGGATVTNDG